MERALAHDAGPALSRPACRLSRREDRRRLRATLPGGAILELLEYQLDGRVQNPEATANPGNMHLCLSVTNAQSAWERAVALGAKPVAPAGPVDVDGGPNKGARAAYLRIHDGITLEMIQPAPGR